MLQYYEKFELKVIRLYLFSHKYQTLRNQIQLYLQEI